MADGIRALAREIGVHPSTVLRRLRRGACPRTGKRDPDQKPQPAAATTPRPKPVPLDPAALVARVNAGERVRDIARDLGCSAVRLYRAADKHGIAIRGGVAPAPNSIRRAIEDMRPAEALEFVLEAYENAVGNDAETLRTAFDLGATPSEAEIFCLLHGRLGHVVYSETILAVCNAHRPPNRQIGNDAVAVYVSILRRKARGRFTIKNIHSIGYKMEPENDGKPL